MRPRNTQLLTAIAALVALGVDARIIPELAPAQNPTPTPPKPAVSPKQNGAREVARRRKQMLAAASKRTGNGSAARKPEHASNDPNPKDVGGEQAPQSNEGAP